MIVPIISRVEAGRREEPSERGISKSEHPDEIGAVTIFERKWVQRQFS